MQEIKNNRSLGDLFSELTLEVRTLFRKEMELLKSEMSDKMVEIVKDAVAIGVGGVLLFVGFLTIVAAIVFGVAVFIPLWFSALIVGMFFISIGLVFVQKGRKNLTHMKMAPEKSTETFKETVQWAKTELR